ncbi:MAG: hypothetical protein IPI04_18535 [Ignavibacteria bacterium]|nr:hypothetical protein [Ignavibacteria bacterium]
MKNFTASILLFISFLTVTNSYSQWTQSSSGINGRNVKCGSQRKQCLCRNKSFTG